MLSPAYLTAMLNGVVVQNHQAFRGATNWRSPGNYIPHAAELPLALQYHNNSVAFRSSTLTVEPVDIYAFYYRKQFACGGEGRVFGGEHPAREHDIGIAANEIQPTDDGARHHGQLVREAIEQGEWQEADLQIVRIGKVLDSFSQTVEGIAKILDRP